MPITLLPDRGVVEVAGEDRVAFLQGLVSNDVALAGPGRAVWAALLSPQGKWLADFFIGAAGGGAAGRLLLDCERAQAPLLVQRLGRFRLRSRAITGWSMAVSLTPGVYSTGEDRDGLHARNHGREANHLAPFSAREGGAERYGYQSSNRDITTLLHPSPF